MGLANGHVLVRVSRGMKRVPRSRRVRRAGFILGILIVLIGFTVHRHATTTGDSAAVPLFELPGQNLTALNHLRAVPLPRFRERHTLPPLTRWGWALYYELNVELAENWGYAVEYPGAARMDLVEAALADPSSPASRVLDLVATDPDRYPLAVVLDRPPLRWQAEPIASSLPPETWARNAGGRRIGNPPVWSPEAPDDVWLAAAAEMIQPLRRIEARARAPIAILLDGGEYGLRVFGHDGVAWSQDPNIQRGRGDRRWFEYVSERKGHQQSLIARALREAFPNRRLLHFYYTINTHRDRNGTWSNWAWDYRDMRHVGDLPSMEIYYRHYNSGWTGSNDMLTHLLNGVARALEFGDGLFYNWVNGGWERADLGEDAHGEIQRYMGFLKSAYNSGMIGATAGYFSPPVGMNGEVVGSTAPHWLQQMIVLSHAHALFSHFEDFLRNGRLLPGPNSHRWRRVPAYEFPTGNRNVRVLVRAHDDGKQWLVTAWAAAGGEAEVTVDVSASTAGVELPNYPGRLTLLARPAGSVYLVHREDNGVIRIWLVDRDGMEPTRYIDEIGWTEPRQSGDVNDP